MPAGEPAGHIGHVFTAPQQDEAFDWLDAVL
jgi:hypothetical protein